MKLFHIKVSNFVSGQPNPTILLLFMVRIHTINIFNYDFETSYNYLKEFQ